jgi:hypothetical protein
MAEKGDLRTSHWGVRKWIVVEFNGVSWHPVEKTPTGRDRYWRTEKAAERRIEALKRQRDA